MSPNLNSAKDRLFRKFSLISLVSVYLLILVGGIVRSTGSGMGCPDWPKCFGQWVPPTEVSQLPADYKEIYSAKRASKNKRFAEYLSFIGFSETADRLLADKSILEEEDFNAAKTWIEYLNRLLGVLVGFFIIGLFISSARLLGDRKRPFVISSLALLTVIFQGWIGSIVVSTNLVPWMVTVHMLLALVVLSLLTFAYFESVPHDPKKAAGSRLLKPLLITGVILMVIQIALGTQVRESVDIIAREYNNMSRGLWIEQLGLGFYIHRSMSLIILGIHIYLATYAWKNFIRGSRVFNLSLAVLGVIVITVTSGAVMAYFGIPAFVQPAHLMLSSLIFGLQILLLLEVSFSRETTEMGKYEFVS